MSDYSRRRFAVSATVEGLALGGLLITAPPNVRYLSGFTGSNGWLLVAGERGFFLTDPRYREQAAQEVVDLPVLVSSTGLHSGLAAALGALDASRLGFEASHVSVALKGKLDAAADAEWVGTEEIVEKERRTKDGREVDAIRAAQGLTEAALLEVAEGIAPGQTEIEVAADLERACRRRGAEGMAFETIVAAGRRSALPHGAASARRIEAGEPVMIDMGCKLDGYCSDLTRMMWCGGRPDPRWLEVHDLVDRARAAALVTIGPGFAAVDVDAAARAVIDDAGYADAFSHGTGHGVGLEIHEAPKVSRHSTDRLEAGMVLTVEPGVYLEGEFGIRIEDLVWVTDDGCEPLTTLSARPAMLRGIA